MSFVYKINSSFDGFTPKRIVSRMDDEGQLALGWKKYIEEVDVHDKVWIYFKGGSRFEPGVYIFSEVRSIDLEAKEVLVHVVTYSSEDPLTNPEANQAVEEVVSAPYRQVFVLPEDLGQVFDCDASESATSCASHLCGNCASWAELPLVTQQALGKPERLEGSEIAEFVPAYWVATKRSYLVNHPKEMVPGIRKSTYMFRQFKLGADNRTYPLALGMFKALAARELETADLIIPIPLSPDKAAAREMHRALKLTEELSALFDIEYFEALELSAPISKRKLGLDPTAFEARYSHLMSCVELSEVERVLLVDDVCTHGSTLRVAAKKIREQLPDCEIIACTAGMMTIREAIRDETSLLID